MTASDDAIFRRLLDFREDVFAVCLGMARNASDAEDLCHDVFLKAFARTDGIRRPGALRVWLLRIARTTCLDHHRRRRRLSTVSVEDLPESSTADIRTPASISAAAEDVRRLKDAIARLPRKQREVLVLREYGELSYEDLSRTLNLRPGTVMSRLNRARLAVASAMEESHD